MDPLRLYVVFDPDFKDGQAWADFISKAFDCVGMKRDGLAFSVPVYRRHCAWGAAQQDLPDPAHPRRIPLDAANRNVVLLIHDAVMNYKSERWIDYSKHLLKQAENREHLDLFIPVQLSEQTPSVFKGLQLIRPADGLLADERERKRFLVRLLNAILVKRDPQDRENATSGGHTIFVSHAKRDGLPVALRIVKLIQKVNEDLGPRCFFDADSLQLGSDYAERFESALKRGSLLALVTDAYHSRPWCRWEVLTAKRLGRAVVAADLTSDRIERTFPYLGNVPSIRVRSANDLDPDNLSDETIEDLTLALLAESLRVAVWRERAQSVAGTPTACLYARPPELSDLAMLAAENDAAEKTLVLYPDPPLTNEETDLLEKGFPRLSLRTLSQMAQ
jgi:TIR domain-containing protein